MTSRKKILVFIDHDLIIRHFIRSGVFKKLEAEHDVKYIFNIDNTVEKKAIHTRPEELGLEHFACTHIPRARVGAWHHLYTITVLHYQRGTKNYRARKDFIKLSCSQKLLWAYLFCALPGIYPIAKFFLLKKQGVFPPLIDMIAKEPPDVILHPTILAGYYINELMQIAKRCHIPLFLLMNSWDNPSQKAVCTGMPDKLIVWGEQTKRHAMEYLRIPENKIEIFGAAQFQLYREPIAESRVELLRLFKLPDDKPIILYGGSSKSARESEHLDLLEQGIESGNIPTCHIIYRPHPWRGPLVEGEKDFYQMDFKHISMDPSMENYYKRAIQKKQTHIEMADYAVTKKLLSVVDAVISPLSTIMLEAILFGRPVLMFFPSANETEKAEQINDINLRMVHFADFWGIEGISRSHEEGELSQACTQLLAQAKDESIRAGLKKHAKFFVDLSGPDYGTRLLQLVNNFKAN